MGKSRGTQTVTNKTELPEWVTNAGQKNLNAAYQVSGNLMGPYSGQRVAGMVPGQLNNVNALQNNVGSTNPAFAFAQNVTANATGYNPSQVNPGYLSGMDLSSYMNPYTQSVISSGLGAIDQQRQMALNQNADQAIRAGAFGGSRHGVTEALTNAQAGMQAGQLASNLMGQNFSQAQSAAQNDLSRNYQAQLANQQAGLQGVATNLQAANQLGGLAQQGQQSYLQGLAAAQAGQDAIQAQNQNVLDARKQYYTEQQQFPLQKLQIPLQALGMTPYGQTQTQTQPTSGSGFLTGLGAASSGLGILQGLMALSDRNAKTDIKKVGVDEETGLNLYAYRYKGDPKSYPKMVGPMAQEVEKKYPEQVVEVNGMKMVNLGFGPMQRAFK